MSIRFVDYSCRYSAGSPLRLRRLSLEIRKGEFVAIIGASGCGKSTLLYSLNGIIPHEMRGSETAGSICMDGVEILRRRSNETASWAATVLQDPAWQLVTFCVEDEIALALENRGIPRSELRRKVDAAAAQAGVEDLLQRSPDELSGGQQQKVAIAAALASEAPILLLDEPLAELDPAGKRSVIETLQRLNGAAGVTIVLVDHNIDFIAPCADRVVVLCDGRLLADGPPREVLGNGELLSRARVRPPVAVQIASLLPTALRPAEIPLSVVELADYLRIRLPRGALRATAVDGGGVFTPSNGDAVISARCLSYRYPNGIAAIDRVDFDIRISDYMGVMGSNGAGKSTLARLMVGLMRPSSGSLCLFREDLTRLCRTTISERVGYVFQNPDYQFFNATCFDEVAFGLRLQKLTRDQIERRVMNCLEDLGIARYRSEHPHFLSRGQRRRLAIASVLVLEPDVLILDEPTTGLDAQTASAMLDAIDRVHAGGCAVVLITHETSIVLERCNRVLLMDSGRILADREPCHLFRDREILRKARVGAPPIAELFMRLQTMPPELPRTPAETAALLAQTSVGEIPSASCRAEPGTAC